MRHRHRQRQNSGTENNPEMLHFHLHAWFVI